MQSGVSSDELAKQVAAALLENVNTSRPQPRPNRGGKENTGKTATQVPASSTKCTKSPGIAHSDASSAVGPTPSNGSGSICEGSMLPNKFETCAPLISGGTPLGTPILAVKESERESTPAVDSSFNILKQYMHAGFTRRSSEGYNLQQNQSSDDSAEEVKHLMRLLEDEKRKNRKLTSVVRILDSEISLFRSRKQTFVSVVGFKLFNKGSSSSDELKHFSGSMVGSDEHVEFFIVVDRSVVPKYVVRHRFNHFKILHRMLETNSFRVPSQNVDHGGDPSFASPLHIPGSWVSAPAPLLQRGSEMIPRLPGGDRRRPSASVGGILNKLGKRLASREPEKEKGSKQKDDMSEKAAQLVEKELKYRAHLCELTGIPGEDLPFFERRAKDLEVYLRQLLSIDVYAESDAMCAFLSPDHDVFCEHRDSVAKLGSNNQPNSHQTPAAPSQANLLAPPCVGPMGGRVSPGGDYIFSNANLAILMGEAIPEHAAPPLSQHVVPLSASQTPIPTPYISQNLPSHQQALSIAHQQQLGNSTWSGPLDPALINNTSSGSYSTVQPRVGKKAIVATVGGRQNQRFTPVASLNPATAEAEGVHSLDAKGTNAIASSPSLNHLAVQHSPSPTPSNYPQSPFSIVFGSNGDFVNPNVTAFSNLVIVADEFNGFPTMLGSDGIADHREQRQRETNAAVSVADHRELLPPLVSRNKNFLLLLSALGFNQSNYALPTQQSDTPFASHQLSRVSPQPIRLASNSIARPSGGWYFNNAASSTTSVDLPQPFYSGQLPSRESNQ